MSDAFWITCVICITLLGFKLLDMISNWRD